MEDQQELQQIKSDGPREDEVMANSSSTSANQAPGLEESVYLDEGETHEVWRPQPQHCLIRDDSATDQQTQGDFRRTQPGIKSIAERKKELMDRVMATQQVLRLQSVEHKKNTGEQQQMEHLTLEQRKTWRSTLRDTYSERARVSRKKLLQTTRPFHNAVSHCTAEASRYGRDLGTHNAVQSWTRKYSRIVKEGSVLEDL